MEGVESQQEEMAESLEEGTGEEGLIRTKFNDMFMKVNNEIYYYVITKNTNIKITEKN